MYSDNVHLLQPTILFSRVCGVCPSALKKLWIPLSNKVYAVLVAIVATYRTLLYAFRKYPPLNDITAFVFACHWIVDSIRTVTTLITPFVFCEELIRFFLIIESVQRSLFGLNIRQLPSPSKISQMLWIALMTTLSMITWLCDILQGNYDTLLLQLAHSLVYLGAFLKMRVLLDLVHEKFSLLTWHLDDLNERWPLFLPRPADVSLREYTSVANHRRTKFVIPSQDDRAVTASKINEFNKTHLKLVYACKTLQRIFSIDWFVGTISIAFQFIVYFYLMSTSKDRLSAISNFINCVVVVLTLVVNLTLTTKIKEKSEKVAILVHDLLDEDRHDDDVLDELEQFSMSLLHRKARFSAAGFFDFDLKLVSKIASLLAPIVLFLVQNDNRPRAGRKRHLLTNGTKV